MQMRAQSVTVRVAIVKGIFQPAQALIGPR
jgi:hypothetical protein